MLTDELFSLCPEAPLAPSRAAELVRSFPGLAPAPSPARTFACADGAATDAMCMFLVLNASSLQLFPATVVSMRAAAGAQSPASIVLPTLCATAVSTLAGGLACAALARR